MNSFLVEKTSQAMNIPRVMALFHLFFTSLSLVALFLMAAEVIAFDGLAVWAIVLSVALNAFFTVLWHSDTRKARIGNREAIPATVERVFPMISLLVPTYNQEQEISGCVKGLFNCALKYRGSSEIIIIDDGSTDNTYESAWAVIAALQKEAPHTCVRILKHMMHLGKTEAVKTGANKAMGEYLALVDAATPFDYVSLNSLIDTISSTMKAMIRSEVRLPEHPGIATPPRLVWVYRADALRRLLNEEDETKALQELGA